MPIGEVSCHGNNKRQKAERATILGGPFPSDYVEREVQRGKHSKHCDQKSDTRAPRDPPITISFETHVQAYLCRRQSRGATLTHRLYSNDCVSKIPAGPFREHHLCDTPSSAGSVGSGSHGVLARCVVTRREVVPAQRQDATFPVLGGHVGFVAADPTDVRRRSVAVL